jgi:hypothetical protein
MLSAIFAVAILATDPGICEPIEPPACRTDADCAGFGVPLRCALAPMPAEPKQKALQCVAVWPSRSQVASTSAELRGIVESLCEQPQCDPDRLHALLGLVAVRESTLRPWKRHALLQDQQAARRSWERRAEVYGWRVRSGVLERLDGAPANATYADRRRWSTGLGWFGMVPSLTVDGWDRLAEPEVLCRPEVAVLVYLRRARRSLAKLARGVDCSSKVPSVRMVVAALGAVAALAGERGREAFDDLLRIVGWGLYHGGADGRGPATWADVHRAASTGALCPSLARDRRFAARAAGVIDVSEAVPLAWVGRDIQRDVQDEWAESVRSRR